MFVEILRFQDSDKSVIYLSCGEELFENPVFELKLS